jgi:predicted nucleic acid-binding protein
VVDTSVLVAGVAAFRGAVAEPTNASGQMLREWIEQSGFIWLITADILEEYKEVLARCGVRRPLIGKIVNLLREEAEMISPRRSVEAFPDPGDAPFWECAEAGGADFIVTLNKKHFAQRKLAARVIQPGDPLPSRRRARRHSTLRGRTPPTRAGGP